MLKTVTQRVDEAVDAAKLDQTNRSGVSDQGLESIREDIVQMKTLNVKGLESAVNSLEKLRTTVDEIEKQQS